MPTTPDPETRKIIHTHEDAFPKKRRAFIEKRERAERGACLAAHISLARLMLLPFLQHSGAY